MPITITAIGRRLSRKGSLAGQDSNDLDCNGPLVFFCLFYLSSRHSNIKMRFSLNS